MRPWCEYALLLALIAVICIVALTTLGHQAADKFSTVGNSIAAAGSQLMGIPHLQSGLRGANSGSLLWPVRHPASPPCGEYSERLTQARRGDADI